MSLMQRLTSLVKADAHGVVDAVEDRSLVLRQHLREAEGELRHKRARLEALEAEEKELGEEGARLAERMRELDGDVSLALDAGKEDLARFSIRRLLPLRQAAQRAAERLERARAERGELAGRLEEQERELMDLKLRVRAYLARGAGEAGSAAEPLVADEEVELELLRRREAAGKEDA